MGAAELRIRDKLEISLACWQQSPRRNVSSISSEPCISAVIIGIWDKLWILKLWQANYSTTHVSGTAWHSFCSSSLWPAGGKQSPWPLLTALQRCQRQTPSYSSQWNSWSLHLFPLEMGINHWVYRGEKGLSVCRSHICQHVMTG